MAATATNIGIILFPLLALSVIGTIALVIALIVHLVHRAKDPPASPGTPSSAPEPEEVRQPSRTLSENLKAHRQRCQFTQEFVAEQLNVSRQAVSKWENGTSDPSTANLLALAKLYGVAVTDLLGQD